jgi:hypothetical protein
MTKQDYLQFARDSEQELCQLIGEYHPIYRKMHSEMDVTAPQAELACEHVREAIRRENPCYNPLHAFQRALPEGDTVVIAQVLQETLVGTPESTSCWLIKGFTEAVTLMEDPVEDENDSN